MVVEAQTRWQKWFLVLWATAAALKLLIASQLPLFVDEAFYWQEGQHLAPAYSDLPGLTAWLTRLGVELGGQHVLALRLPFLAIGAIIPWFVVRMAARWFGPTAGWQAGILCLLMPLSGTLGLLAVPDVPMALAAVLCLHAVARLLRQVNASNAVELALGLAIGALSHYRFLGVIGMGLIALLLLPQGRRLLRDSRVWMALSVGFVAWLPLLAWNADNHDAGLRFQLLDRHPWSFHHEGVFFLLIQPLIVTPLLCGLLWLVAWRGSKRTDWNLQQRYFALTGGISTAMIFALGFFTDVERISFHWPLPGYLALLVAAPALLLGWSRRWRRLLWLSLLLGWVVALGYYAMASSPQWRQVLADNKFYPRNFIGWEPLAEAVRDELAQMPAGTRILAGSFKVGSELGFQLGDDSIAVLPHALNDRHGRTAQLALWKLIGDGRSDVPQLLVINPADQRFRDLLARYQQLCQWVGPLPGPRTVSIDHGRQRFLLMRLPPRPAGVVPDEACVTPALAWIDSPLPRATVGDQAQVRGWAFKDGVGLRSVELLLDGKPVMLADYGRTSEVRGVWAGSSDPQHPQVGFDARLDLSALPPGTHWLGLRLHGNDGSVEDWSEQRLHISR
ncbi:membrane protein [Stenotrophomonas ginsengisoli]|uniref:Membrane protein n=1 Tax=Stenotrophomonas ginsengisoli TaxID=336566 RepID=A0A0R0DBX7_9GAMM|nr:glycosyltransferase family 39 protein [Stenotrophomonas ginsengisoli]KRG79152.1 membrane protein [Stenotrophomonas ginsengisoli]